MSFPANLWIDINEKSKLARNLQCVNTSNGYISFICSVNLYFKGMGGITMGTDTKKRNVIDNFHGVEVIDPYRWLEDEDSPQIAEWIDKQNKDTRKFLDAYTDKEMINSRLKSLYDYKRYSTPQKEGDYYYFHKNDGLQNQPVFCRTTSLEFKDVEIILDPNTLTEEGTAAITTISFNDDGSLMAFTISKNGSDWQEVKVMNMKTMDIYEDSLVWCKFCTIAWTKIGKSFYYDRYPDPNTIAPSEESYYNKVYLHVVGDRQEEDKFIYDVPNKKEFSFNTIITDDKKYLVLEVKDGTENKNRIHYKNNDSESSFITLIEEANAYYSFLGSENSTFYFQTNLEASNGKVIAVDINQPDEKYWKEIIPESQHAISFVKLINEYLVVCKMKNASSLLQLFNKNGKLVKNLEFPRFITISEVTGKPTSKKMLISYESFLQPTKFEEYDFRTDEQKIVMTPDTEFKNESYETTQVFYPSRDGTEVSMFLVHKKGLKLTGNHPVFLYSYGGYGVSLTPTFSPSNLLWLEAGGIYAVANIRGGGEYGNAWHTAALFEKRQNAFDDFAKAAEWLISNNYTNSKKIAISGASNGGLLVAVSITQNPHLFGAALCQVPVTDMLRFHKFTVGRFWTSEFGNAEVNRKDFSYLYGYSPLHNVQKNTIYPPVLITTADSDDRVVPLHAYKFAATLQASNGCKNTTLLRVDKNAGHGLGKPISKIINEETDIYTFLFKSLEMKD